MKYASVYTYISSSWTAYFNSQTYIYSRNETTICIRLHINIFIDFLILSSVLTHIFFFLLIHAIYW